MLLDEKPVRLAKAENYQAIHLMVPRRGVAVHINAFNFPSWGLWEKAAVSLLAGVPVFAKPASSTALLAHEMVRDVVAAKALPEGALSLLVGGANDLLDHLTSDDVIAFTGSADTAARVRGHRNVVARSVPVNIEADSINAALLAPDAAGGGAAFDAFIREVVREMTVKAGQKCTAIRRIFVPAGQGRRYRRGAVRQAQEHQGRRSAQRGHAHGPAGDARAAAGRVRRHPQARAARPISSSATTQPPALDGIDADKAAFVAPTLLRVKDAKDADAVHEVEVFGPAATIVPYKDEKDACAQVARGGGSLVASVYGEDKDFLARMVAGIGASHGRLLMIDPVDRLGAYRPRHRHAAVQSRRSRPRRRRRGARRALRPALLSPAPGGAGLDRAAGEPAGAGGGAALIAE